MCRDCKKSLKYIHSPACMKCGRQLEREEQEYCSECQSRLYYYSKGYAIWQYDDSMRQSLADFKYRSRKEFADFYAEEAARIYGDAIRRERPEVLIPVPIHRSKRKERGFNQAQVFAKKLGRKLGIPTDDKYLLRVKETQALKELGGKARAAALKGAFAVCADVESKYESVMLVDDIYTTGSTVNECAKALIEAGVKRVTVFCVAIGASYSKTKGKRD